MRPIQGAEREAGPLEAGLSPAAPAPAPAVDAHPSLVLALQRSAGNAAVARMMGAGLARRCACGGVAGPDGECAECRRRRLAGQQVARQPTAPAAAPVGAEAVVIAVRADDVPGVVTALSGFDTAQLMALRQTVNAQIDTPLELWLARRRARGEAAKTLGKAAALLGAAVPGVGTLVAPVAGGLLGSSGDAASATAEKGLRLLWPALGLIERLQVYDEGWRELEQAQIDVIKGSTEAQRVAARGDPRLETILAAMDPKEEWEARGLIDPTPEGRYTAAERLLERAPSVFGDEEDGVFDALMKLSPGKRKAFYSAHSVELSSLLSADRFILLGRLCTGSEAQALIERLREATEGRSDDMAAVQAVVDRAVELLKEREDLRKSLARTDLPANVRAEGEARVKELADLDDLITGKGEQSFMGMLAAARGAPGAFGADAKRLAGFATDRRQFAKDTAERRIVLSDGNVDEIRSALMQLHAPPPEPAPADGKPAQPNQAEDEKLRKEVLALESVRKVVDSLTGQERMLVDAAIGADAFAEIKSNLNDAFNGARWGEFFHIVLTIARNDDWNARFRETAKQTAETYTRVSGDQRTIMEEILRTKKVPIKALLAFTGDVDVLKGALSDVGEDVRGELRQGAMLAFNPPIGPPDEKAAKALAAFREFEAQLKSSQTTLKLHFDDAGYKDVLWTVLGSEPTLDELKTEEGRFQAAELMYQEEQSTLKKERGASAELTETDETMVAAAREFAGHFEPLRPSRKLSAIDLYALTTLHDRFKHRTSEFSEASNTIGEMAGMVAATVAGVIVVAATGGAATPGVIALAAAAGGGARVVTQEMFGEEFYDPKARDALLGAVDGALAVVGASLAEKGAALVGLGGRALATSAARTAGVVAEEASQTLGRKVASGAVQAALDGAFSGSVSQGFSTMTDPLTWRRGVWQGMVTVGQSALVAGLTGLGTGALIGAAMPVAGAGASKLWGAVAGQSIETTLAKAGAKETLEAARAAARRGDAAEVEKLFGKLETHLSADEANALRQQLNKELTGALGHPPGRAEPTEAQAKVLAETKTLDGDKLSPTQLEAEKDIVRRSDPQPSTLEGYVDEVDLGNEHTWRREPEDTWCRFSRRSICGTKINGAKQLTEEAKAKVRQTESKIANLRELQIEQRKIAEAYPGIVEKLKKSPGPNGRVNLSVLTEEEIEILGQVFPKDDLEKLPLQRVTNSTALPGGELGNLFGQEEAAIAALRDAKRPLYDKARAASPSGRARAAVERRAGKFDEFLRGLPPSGALDVDHVLSLNEIVNMRGFDKLDWAEQVAILNDPENLRAVDRALNRSRGDMGWAEFLGNGVYSREVLERARAVEEEIRGRIQRQIAEKAGAGVP